MNGCQASESRHLGLALTLSLAALISAPSAAGSARLSGARDGPQSVSMCANCAASVPCARVGDFGITLSAEFDRPSRARSVRFLAGLVDRHGVPVNDAAVTLVLPAADRSAPPQVVPMQGTHGGLYTANATLGSDPLRDTVRATVIVTTPKGDRVKQRFVLGFLMCHRPRS